MSNYFIGYANSEAVTTSTKTLDEGDAGVVQFCEVDCTITMPAVTVGRSYTIAQGPGAQVTLSPNAADKFMGNGFTSADDKDIIGPANFGGTAYVTVVGSADGWNIQYINGTWTRQA